MRSDQYSFVKQGGACAGPGARGGRLTQAGAHGGRVRQIPVDQLPPAQRRPVLAHGPRSPGAFHARQILAMVWARSRRTRSRRPGRPATSSARRSAARSDRMTARFDARTASRNALTLRARLPNDVAVLTASPPLSSLQPRGAGPDRRARPGARRRRGPADAIAGAAAARRVVGRRDGACASWQRWLARAHLDRIPRRHRAPPAFGDAPCPARRRRSRRALRRRRRVHLGQTQPEDALARRPSPRSPPSSWVGGHMSEGDGARAPPLRAPRAPANGRRRPARPRTSDAFGAMEVLHAAGARSDGNAVDFLATTHSRPFLLPQGAIDLHWHVPSWGALRRGYRMRSGSRGYRECSAGPPSACCRRPTCCSRPLSTARGGTR